MSHPFTDQLYLYSTKQRIIGAEAERNFYESQLIILDTLEQVLNSVSILFKFYPITVCT